MKRTLLTLALVTAAGAAGAQTVTTPPVGGATVTSPTAAPRTVTTPQAPSAGSAGVTTPGVNPPSVTTPGVPSQTINAPNTANAPALPNAPGSANALKKIQADGYKNVQGLQRNPDGSWSGKALRGGAAVDVHVDARGNVITK